MPASRANPIVTCRRVRILLRFLTRAHLSHPAPAAHQAEYRVHPLVLTGCRWDVPHEDVYLAVDMQRLVDDAIAGIHHLPMAVMAACIGQEDVAFRGKTVARSTVGLSGAYRRPAYRCVVTWRAGAEILLKSWMLSANRRERAKSCLPTKYRTMSMQAKNSPTAIATGTACIPKTDCVRKKTERNPQSETS